MKNIVTCCLVFIFLSTTLMAQKVKLERANREFEQFNYSEAIILYQGILEKNDVSEAKIKLAESFRKIDNMGEAEYWYGQVVHLPDPEPIYVLYYAQALQANGKCDLAKEWFNKYNESAGDMRSGNLITTCDKEFVDQLLRSRKDFYEVQHLKQINTKYDDFGPVFYKKGLVFSSERDDTGPANRIHDWTGFPFLELYYSDIDTINAENLEFSYDDKPSKYDSKLNTKYHDGPITFAPDQSIVYFTRNNISEKNRVGKDSEGTIRLKIFSAKSKDNKWSELKGVPFNSDEYSVVHPTISADGNTMYFSSDMPGGFGDMDLYYSVFDGGQWAPPKNMGPRINTEGNEVFPVIHPKTGRLYFSSDGHAGLGMLDVFFVDNNEGVWGAVINIGFPINSNADDHGLIMNNEENFGYFVSNRNGGVGRDDIYSFRYAAARIEVLVYDENSGEPIEEAVVLNDCSNMQLKTGVNGKVIFEMPLNMCCTFLASKQTYDDNKRDTCTNGMKSGTELLVKIPLSRPLDFEIEGIVYDEETGAVIPDAKVTLNPDCTGTPIVVATDAKGYYRFVLNKKCCCDLKAEKKDYLIKSTDKPYCTKGLKESKKFVHNFYLNKYLRPEPIDTTIKEQRDTCPVTFILEHIYYDFDKAYIRSDAEEPLVELIKILEDNPNLVVEIGSHTDARGSNRYNEKLSQRRAKSVVKYLEGRGIPANRLEYQGYGENQPTNECVDEIPCDEEKHQRNRRTEFRIVGLIDGTRYNCNNNARVDEYSVQPIVLKKIDRCENCPF
jgi:outer membrane protein OmpA-like peptidoglycan-associated protein